MRTMSNKVIRSEMFGENYFKTGNYKNYKENALVWTGRVAQRIKRMADKAVPNVLDVGCAHGYLITTLQSIGCQVKGLEYSPYVINEADKEVREKIEQGSILDNRFRKNEFDAVVCLNALEYIPEEKVEMALSNLVKWTDDLIFFTTCFKHSRYSSQKHSPDNLRITIKTEKEWMKSFQQLGASHEETFYDGGGGDVLVFRKNHEKTSTR